MENSSGSQNEGEQPETSGWRKVIANFKSSISRERRAEEQIPEKTEVRTTLSTLRKNISKGTKLTLRGAGNIFKGGYELAIGLAREVDAVALGLGALAIITVGEIAVAPARALVSKDKDITDTTREVLNWAQRRQLARAVGYPLLAMAGYSGYLQLKK